MNSDNYPMGAYNDSNAPWNERETPQIEVFCVTTVPLQKTITVLTNNYVCELDEDGYVGVELIDGYQELREYVLDQHYGIDVMLEELSKYIKEELANENLNIERKWYLKQLLEDCQGWEIGDIDIEDHNL